MPTSARVVPDLQALYEDAACGLLLTDSDGTIERVNQTFCRWTGRSADELVGRCKVQELLTMGGRIFHQTHWAPLLRMQGSIAEVKLEIVHRDGRAVPMVMNAVRREQGDTVWHELAIFSAEDRHQYERELLVARRRAEELLAKERQAQQALSISQARLRLALEAAQLYVWNIDPATGERRYDDEVALLLGHEAAQPVSQQQFIDCIEPQDREHEALAFAQARDPANGLYSCSYRLRGFDGVQRTVSATGRGQFGDDGALLQFVGMLNDISDLSRQRALAEDRALFAEQMIGIVSHDLRNPLAAIHMSAHLLERGDLNAMQLRVVGRIGSSTARANRMIAELLDFTQARIGAGLAIAPKAVDLHALVADAVDELALAYPQHKLKHHSSGEGECIVDADRLAQLVGNLVSNAITHGAVDAAVTVRSNVEPAEFAVEVNNQGAPIPDELLPRLFEPMTRGHEAGSTAGSVGLGLFIVREIVRAHGGDVTVLSDAQHGTTFTTRFPR